MTSDDRAYEYAALGLMEKLGVPREEAEQRLKRARDPRALVGRLRRQMRAQQNALERRYYRRVPERFKNLSELRHGAARYQRRKDLEKARELMSLGERLDVALAQAKSLSAVAAGGVERGSSPAEEAHEPPPIAGACYHAGEGSVYDIYADEARELIARLEAEVDGGGT